MARIQVAELNTLTRLQARELEQVVGGSLLWGNIYSLSYTSKKIDLTSYDRSFIGQNANNNSVVLQGGYTLANVAQAHQSAANLIA